MTPSETAQAPLRIRLAYATLDEFVERYGTNVTRGGFFVSTSDLRPEGSRVEFEVLIDGGTQALRGEGLVQKAHVDEGGTRSGMTLRFLEVDPATRALVERVVNARQSLPQAQKSESKEPRAPSARRSRLAAPVAPLDNAPLEDGPVWGIDWGSTAVRAGFLDTGAESLVAVEVAAGPLLPGTSELAAQALVTLREGARANVGIELRRAVLCVPCTWTHAQRKVLRDVAREAGIEVVRLVNEPSAAALAVGFGKGLARKRVLVYELGAGGFQASVVELTGDDAEVVSAGGSELLGGMDFDRRLARELYAALLAQLPELAGIDLGPSLLVTAEQAKKDLSQAEAVDVQIELPESRPPGAPGVWRGSVDRRMLGRFIADLIDGTIAVSRAVLASAGLTSEGLDEIVLVGGQTRSPLVRLRVEEAFRRPVRAEANASGSALMGAAILGRSLCESQSGKRGARLSDVLAVPITVGARDGTLRTVFAQNTRLPAEKSLAFEVGENEVLELAVFQGSSTTPVGDDFLGRAELAADRPGEVSLHFRVNADAALQLLAEARGRPRREIPLTPEPISETSLRALLARAPLFERQATPDGGLFQGIRKLWSRR